MILSTTVESMLVMGMLLVLGQAEAANVKTAKCVMVAGVGVSPTVQGTISLSEANSGLTLVIKLSGFDSTDNTTSHGFHVHANGSTGNKCADAGPHYNVDGSNHGAPTNPQGSRHAGDFGNLNETSDGRIDTTLTFNFASLAGPNSIANRSLVVHEFIDDLGLAGNEGSKTTGNSGKRLGCCVVVLDSNNSPKNTISILSLLLVGVKILYF